MKRLVGAAALCVSLIATAFAAPRAGGRVTTTTVTKDHARPLQERSFRLDCVGPGGGCRPLRPSHQAFPRAQAAEARQAVRARPHPTVTRSHRR